MLLPETWKILPLPERSSMAPKSPLSRLLREGYGVDAWRICLSLGAEPFPFSPPSDRGDFLLHLPTHHGGVSSSDLDGGRSVCSAECSFSTHSSLSSPSPTLMTSVRCLLPRAR